MNGRENSAIAPRSWRNTTAFGANTARAIWTGTIGFGLVQIPVGLHGAEDRAELEIGIFPYPLRRTYFGGLRWASAASGAPTASRNFECVDFPEDEQTATNCCGACQNVSWLCALLIVEGQFNFVAWRIRYPSAFAVAEDAKKGTDRLL